MAEATKKMATLVPGLCKFGHTNPALQAFLAKYRNNKVPVSYMTGTGGTTHTEI